MWSKLRLVKERDAEGQGLLELALALPVLLIVFLGLIELSLVLRAYLVLVNANREGVRLAAKGDRFSDDQIALHALASFAGQLPASTVGPNANTGIIITHFNLPAQKDNPEHPATYRTPIYVTGTLTHTSKISPTQYLDVLKNRHDEFNDDLKREYESAARATQHIVVVEIYYYHRQILHAPIVEWVFPDPIVLYSRTTMRIGESRVR